ncbi:alpha/beta fold hydrolase [Parazoarcus communis]|jgi:pimeloyl-ACP methyl ester carboxylesterase|nr:alpha/beta fold hydrolase [Parazoarcus communis]
MTRTMILIHGAWQGSWSFASWRPLLARRGWTAHAVDLPGNGWGEETPDAASLDAYVEHVAACIEEIGEPVVVLGHSGGGIVASQVAEAIPERVACTVYLAGMMLPSGMSYASLVEVCKAEHPELDFAGVGPHLEYSADGRYSAVPPEVAQRIFLHDCAPSDARYAASLLRPQAERGRIMAPSLSPNRYGKVPRIYVEATQDRSLLHASQRKMQALSPGAIRVSLDCGHVPQLAAPERLTELLCTELEQLLP